MATTEERVKQIVAEQLGVDEGQVTNDQVLSQFLAPFGGAGPTDVTDRVHLIAINEGRLMDFLQGRRDDFPYLYREVREFSEDAPQEDDITVVVVKVESREFGIL